MEAVAPPEDTTVDSSQAGDAAAVGEVVISEEVSVTLQSHQSVTLNESVDIRADLMSSTAADSADADKRSAQHTVQDIQQVSALDVLAYVNGQPFVDAPKDLFIPPEALEVILESFEGPLDLLLYLIRKNNLDVLDIPVAEVTRQYMEYVQIMKQFHLELAADYLVMAALLGEIKSRCLLPRQVVEDEDEVDPRQELIRRLQEYERFKTAAEDIDAMPRLERDIHAVQLPLPKLPRQQRFPEVGMQELLLAFREVLIRANLTEHHHIAREKLSTRERMTRVLARLREREYLLFPDLFEPEEGRGGVIVSFLAILELLKEGLIEVVQHEPFGAIYVAARTRVRSEGGSIVDESTIAGIADVLPVQSEAREMPVAADQVDDLTVTDKQLHNVRENEDEAVAES
jgi:segregation and condensation protein A